MTVNALELPSVKQALSVDDDSAEEDTLLTNIINAARELANNQAPDAPQSVANEAMLRFVGYVYEGPMPNAIDGVQDAGIWRKCGAAGLLSPWTVRRAGVIAKPETDT